MANEREQRIRERAHEIWEREGRPDGRDQEHWDLASREIQKEEEGLTGRSERPDRTGAENGIERDRAADLESGQGRAAKRDARDSQKDAPAATSDKSRA